MFRGPAAIVERIAQQMASTSRKRCVLAAATAFLLTASAASAVQYDFLTVLPTGSDTSQFTSPNGKGTIDVSHVHSAGGAGGADNVNTAINSQFSILFPGTGLVDGHLAQSIYNNTIKVSFDLTNYELSGRTAFGIWNCTDEVPVLQPAPAVYRIQLINSNDNEVDPTTFALIGNQDNQADVLARSQLVMNPATGDITAGGFVNGGSGVHMNAAFWKNIPIGTKKIIVYGDLPFLNNIGDGVGYYFAEVPEPTSFGLAALALFSLGVSRRMRKR